MQPIMTISIYVPQSMYFNLWNLFHLCTQPFKSIICSTDFKSREIEPSTCAQETFPRLDMILKWGRIRRKEKVTRIEIIKWQKNKNKSKCQEIEILTNKVSIII